MVATEQNEVLHRGFTAISPMQDVVPIYEARVNAPGEFAAGVAPF